MEFDMAVIQNVLSELIMMREVLMAQGLRVVEGYGVILPKYVVFAHGGKSANRQKCFK